MFRRRVNVAVTAAAMVAASAMATPALAEGKDGCHVAEGKAVWTLIPPSVAPASDPLGRVAGPTTGDLKAAVTAYLTGISFEPDGVHTTSVETWVVGPQDVLLFSGIELFTPIPGTADVVDKNTITVIGGSGKYAGATGTLDVTGTGYNFLPSPTPGSTFFELRYRGTICISN